MSVTWQCRNLFSMFMELDLSGKKFYSLKYFPPSLTWEASNYSNARNFDKFQRFHGTIKRLQARDCKSLETNMQLLRKENYVANY
jgi:hypothetical protein